MNKQQNYSVNIPNTTKTESKELYNISYFSGFWKERVTVEHPVTKEIGESIIKYEESHQPDRFGYTNTDYRLEPIK